MGYLDPARLLVTATRLRVTGQVVIGSTTTDLLFFCLQHDIFTRLAGPATFDFVLTNSQRLRRHRRRNQRHADCVAQVTVTVNTKQAAAATFEKEEDARTPRITLAFSRGMRSSYLSLVRNVRV